MTPVSKIACAEHSAPKATSWVSRSPRPNSNAGWRPASAARTGRRISLLAAAVAVVAIGSVAALSNGWLRLPAIGSTVSPSPLASPSPSMTSSVALAPIPATPGRIEVTRIDPTTPADPVDRTFQGEIKDAYVALHVTVSCLGDGTLDFYLDGQREPVICSSEGETSVGGTLNANDDVLDYRLVTTGRISFGILVELQVLSEPLPSDDPAQSPPAFTPPSMQVSVSTLGRPGETLDLSTGCWFTYALADGTSGDGGCAEPSMGPMCCETLDVPWGADLTFSFPDGWTIAESDIDSIGQTWVDQRPAATRVITGWRQTGDETLRFEGTFTKDGDTFTTSFGVPIHGPTAVPRVPAPRFACQAPDLTVSSPPAVQLFVDGEPSTFGEFGTNSWMESYTDSPADPMPQAAVEVALGAPLTLRIAGNVCATSWAIEYGPAPSGSGLSVDRVGSLALPHRTPPDGAADGFANGFSLAALPAGDWFIEAGFGYADGSAAMGWHVIVR